MKFLLDTNIFIPLEPSASGELHPRSEIAASLLRLLVEGGHQYYVHPELKTDLSRDRDLERQRQREVVRAKYPVLHSPPNAPDAWKRLVGDPVPRTNDWVDIAHLAAVYHDAVDYLVTEDVRLRRKSRRVDLGERVLSVDEAISTVRGLYVEQPSPPPSVKTLKAYELDEADPIFESLRTDYHDFDNWLRRCKREHRDAWVILGSNGHYAAVGIVKQESVPNEASLKGRVLKISTFKVSEVYGGFKYGELLLKSILVYCHSNRFHNLYVTVFPKHVTLLTLFEEFGFERRAARTERHEYIYTKSLTPTAEEETAISPLDFHIKYGPPAMKLLPGFVFVVPIRPVYHRMLFPDAEYTGDAIDALQLSLVESQPFGNAIKKAYLCHSPSRLVQPGACLLFYRSHDQHAVSVVGVAESILVSSQVDAIARFVGKRTVYNIHEIDRMCARRQTLAILFRQDRILDAPLIIDELLSQGVLGRPPQSITRVPREATEWLKQRLSA